VTGCLRFTIRRARIPVDWKDAFEETGVKMVRMAAVGSGVVLFGGKPTGIQGPYVEYSFAWLTEQRDREEVKDTWSLAMEASITILVAVELLFSVLGFFNVHWPQQKGHSDATISTAAAIPAAKQAASR
jgi:hypothetical protein